MQTATQTIISGSIIPFILDGGTDWSPSDLDFFAGRDMGQLVVTFLKKTGEYTQRKISNQYSMSDGIRRIWTLENHRGKKINVIEALSSNPFDAVIHLHSTCVMGAVTASGIWHAYPELTMKSQSLMTPFTLPLKNTVKYHRHVWMMLREHVRRGFSFHLGENSNRHTCGQDPNCPVTLRSTCDRGCMFIPFPTWDCTNDVEPHRAVCWTLGGTGCRHGHMRVDNNDNVLSFDELPGKSHF